MALKSRRVWRIERGRLTSEVAARPAAKPLALKPAEARWAAFVAARSAEKPWPNCGPCLTELETTSAKQPAK